MLGRLFGALRKRMRSGAGEDPATLATRWVEQGIAHNGTGELAGLTGKLDIKITDGKHFYEFDYTLAEVP